MSIQKQSIESRAALAQKYLNKYLVSDDTVIKVTRICVYMSLEEFKLSWDMEDMGKKLSRGVKQEFKNQGNLVVLCGAADDGSDEWHLFVINAETFKTKLKIGKKPVRINGFTGKDKGDHFEFGCAKIDKGILIAAKKFFEEAGWVANSGNRNVEGVKIGDGVFTAEDINNLV